MVNFRVKVEGLENLGAASQRAQRAIVRQLNIGLLDVGHKVEKDAKDSIRGGSKSGRIYQRRTVTHRASAPGEAPANDTGRLLNGIRTKLDTIKLAVEVLAFARDKAGKVNYAYELEFGNSRVAARPFLFPALERNKAWIRSRLEQALGRGIRDGAKR